LGWLTKQLSGYTNMNRAILVGLLWAVLPCTQIFAQLAPPVSSNVTRVSTWDDRLGSIVEVEGLAWGAMEKGLGDHILMPHNKVYLKNLDLLKTDLNGKLIRVAGVLRKSRVNPAEKFSQGYTRAFEYYWIETISFKQIEKVTEWQLLPTSDDWIVPGISADSALKLVSDRQLQPYPLALAASKDGSTTHSYLVSEGIVLVYRELKGNIVSVSQIKLNGVGKVDDDWLEIPGFRLPSVAQKSQ